MADSKTNLKPVKRGPLPSRRNGMLQANHLQKKERYRNTLTYSPSKDMEKKEYHVAILKNLKAIENLLPEWRDLFSEMQAQASEGSTQAPFTRPDVLACWARVAEPEMDSLFVVTLRTRANGKLRAVFPGFLCGNILRMLSDDVTDYQDIAALTQKEGVELMRRVIEISNRKRYRLDLYKVSDLSILWTCLQKLSDCHLAKRILGPCPYGNFEIRKGGDFLNAISKKRRKNHKAAASKIRRGIPDGKMKHLRGEEITPEVIEKIANLHIANQYRKSGESVFKKPAISEWLLALASVDSDLNIALFYDGDELAAFSLSFVNIEQRTFYYYIPSLSDQYLTYSLGTWLLVESLRHHAPANGGSFRLDLLCGDEGYKKMWATNRYHVWRMILFPRSISHLLQYRFYRSVYAMKKMKATVLSLLQESRY